jgi:hypothetical protein
MVVVAVALAAVALLAVVLFAATRRLLLRSSAVAHARIIDPEEHTTMDERGAVRSVQAAEITLPVGALDAMWTPMHLERLAATYWRYLTRMTLGLIRVKYDADERAIVFISRPLVLLRFKAPEYELDGGRGRVRWRIRDGVLVSPRDRDDGHLQIEVRRCDPVDEHTGRIQVEVEVANFYPALATAVARWFYKATQSRIHVFLTHGFLRSLARLDLADSVVGRYVPPATEDAPGPPAEPEHHAA